RPAGALGRGAETVAPARASSTAIARPAPRVAPATRATLPASAPALASASTGFPPRPSGRQGWCSARTSRARCCRPRVHGPARDASRSSPATAKTLPFRDATFDAVLCQLGLQFFPDPARSLSEFRRVLRVGGRAAVCVVSTPDRAPMWGVLADALGRRLLDQRVALHLSFALADAERLGRLLATHFRDVRVTRETRAGSFASFAD